MSGSANEAMCAVLRTYAVLSAFRLLWAGRVGRRKRFGLLFFAKKWQVGE